MDAHVKFNSILNPYQVTHLYNSGWEHLLFLYPKAILSPEARCKVHLHWEKIHRSQFVVKKEAVGPMLLESSNYVSLDVAGKFLLFPSLSFLICLSWSQNSQEKGWKDWRESDKTNSVEMYVTHVYKFIITIDEKSITRCLMCYRHCSWVMNSWK